jgi:hypothetical protein
MSWNTLAIESFCFADQVGDKYPCGQECPTHFCLGDKDFGMCPHFAWGETNEREVAVFVPLRLLIWDRIKIWSRDFTDHIVWLMWGSLWFNRRKVDDFFDSIPVVSAKDSPVVAQWDENHRLRMLEFTSWIQSAKLNAEKEQDDIYI